MVDVRSRSLQLPLVQEPSPKDDCVDKAIVSACTLRGTLNTYLKAMTQACSFELSPVLVVSKMSGFGGAASGYSWPNAVRAPAGSEGATDAASEAVTVIAIHRPSMRTVIMHTALRERV